MQEEERRLDPDRCGPPEVPHEFVRDEVSDGAGDKAAVERAGKLGISRG